MSTRQISDYALIGDGETAALVGRGGAIEWLCLPRFDSAACFAAILGDKENGCWHMTLADEVSASERRYRGDSLILETELTTSRGKARITDFMPIRGEAPDIVRIVECLQGEVEITSELFLRFDYGRIHPLVRHVSDQRCLAISGPDAVSLDFDADIEFDERRFTSRASLSAGDRSAFVLTWYRSHLPPPDRVDPQQALADTEGYWAKWREAIDYSGPYEKFVIRSLITLKALIHRPTGGIIAAPTSSLPEQPGGPRNWDYRYCWLRDATFTLLALTAMGLREEACAWIAWLSRAVGGEPVDVRPFYTVDGGPRTIEWEAEWLPGFNGAKPVRFGNGAQDQLQLDIYGEAIDALFRSREIGIVEHEECDQLVRLIVGRLEELWERPDAGIWESRGEPRQHTYSKVMSWVAFDRASAWFRGRDDALSNRCRDSARKVQRMVLDKGFDEKRNSFTSAFGETSLDAALLRLPLVGFLPADDGRIVGTVAAIEEGLCRNGLVLRYRADETDDGISGAEGTFVAASFWLAEVYQLQGRTGDARRLFERIVGHANDLGLLAEELEPVSGMQLGNFPQGLSHIALIRAAIRLSDG